jgi:hypothetical protein
LIIIVIIIIIIVSEFWAFGVRVIESQVSHGVHQPFSLSKNLLLISGTTFPRPVWIAWPMEPRKWTIKREIHVNENRL